MARAEVEFRDDPAGGKIIVWTRPAGDPRYTYADEVPGLPGWVHIYRDDETDEFVGIWHDYPPAIPSEIPALRKLPLPPVDFPEAGLFGVHPTEVLAWAYRKHFPQPA